MKDVVHHLKHVQKKVIQSVRRAEASLSKTCKTAHPESEFTLLLEPTVRQKRKDMNNQLRKSLVRMHLH